MAMIMVQIGDNQSVQIEARVDQQARVIVIEGLLVDMATFTKDAVRLQACVAVVNSYHTLNIDVQWEKEEFSVIGSVIERYVVPFELITVIEE